MLGGRECGELAGCQSQHLWVRYPAVERIACLRPRNQHPTLGYKHLEFRLVSKIDVESGPHRFNAAAPGLNDEGPRWIMVDLEMRLTSLECHPPLAGFSRDPFPTAESQYLSHSVATGRAACGRAPESASTRGLATRGSSSS